MAYNNMKIPFATVQAIREAYAKGEASIYRLAKQYKLARPYVSHLVHGAVRQTEHSRTPVFARLSRNELLRHPSGKLFPRRPHMPKGRPMIVAQIPFPVICSIRHEREMNGTPLVDLAVKYGLSLSHVRRIVLKLTRRSA